jgi:hypothetical protein
MMEAASTSETSANFYQTTRRNNPHDSHLHTRRRENLKSRLKICHDRFLSQLLEIQLFFSIISPSIWTEVQTQAKQ